jgi:serine/threonine protein kinase/Tol biopolymer transport system component
VVLQPGVRLGPYEILALVDAGGMGEVYRARDTRLRRDVAIKVLAGYDASSPDRLQRFDREARAAAALNHQNILAVHDVGNEGGVPFIVSELLEGGTLREVIESGRPLPVRKVVDIATQVGRALAAAHARGIVHRDLKPENLFLCRDGTVKVLDFGLARLTEIPTETSGATVSLTAENTIVGTVGYMAPEQLRGHEIDHRADVFAFGVVVYEMLAGRRAFTGDSSADVMTAILTTDPPDLLESVPAMPPVLARIVSRCLEKRRDARFQSASDLTFALEALSAPSGAVTAPQRDARRGPSVRLLTTAGALIVIAATGFAVWKSRESSPWPSRALSVQRLTDFEGVEEFPALSPDAKSVAFTAGVKGIRQVFVRLVAGGTPLQITNAAADHQYPRWAPDSSSVTYFSPAAAGEPQGDLWEVSALGGAPRRLAASLGGADISGVDGRMTYFRLADRQVELVAALRDGSNTQVIRRFTPGSYYWYPRWSPDGRSIAYQKGDGVRFDLFVVSASGGEPRSLTNDNALLAGFAWRPDGEGVIYSSSRENSIPYLPTLSLWEARLDGGPPRPVLSDEVSYMYPDLHPSGAMVVSRMRRRIDIWRFAVRAARNDPDAAPMQVTRQTGHVHTPTASPDGTELAFLSDSGGHSNLWVRDLQSGAERQITHERDPHIATGVPIWSPDGKSIAFVSSRGNPGLVFGIWLVNPDGGNVRNLVPRGLGATWSPDGRWVYFVERANDVVRKVSVDGGSPVVVRSEPARNVIGIHGSTLYFLVERALVDGRPEFEIRAADPEDGPSRVVTRVSAARLASWQVVNPALSPDGKWLAQALTDGLTTNVWIAETSAGEWQQITDFGDRATYIARRVCWSPDGRYLFAAVAEGDADIIRLER